MKVSQLIVALVVVAGIAGCQQQQAATNESTQKETAVAAVAALPESLVVAAPIADAKPLSDVRATAKAGETTTLVGYIGGRSEPFTDGRAVFVVADLVKAPPCSDGCPTPYDACCTPKEEIAANSASIQVVDANGQPLKVGLEGHASLKPGSIVEVSGKVREAAPMLIVDAVAIHVRATN